MFRLIFVLGMCIVFGVTSHALNDQECPFNEEPVECVNDCYFCEDRLKVCPRNCIPGCNCLPGYERSRTGYCVPQIYCTAYSLGDEFENLQPETQLPQHVLTKYGCPDISKCISHCKRHGSTTGSCIGPKSRTCQCSNKTAVGEHKTTSRPNEPEINNNKSLGCPDIIKCSEYCWNHGSITGSCVGHNNGKCICSKDRSGEQFNTDSSPIFLVDLNILKRHGCPNVSICTAYCKKHNANTGSCAGPDNRACICFGDKKRFGDGMNSTSIATDDPKELKMDGCPNISICIACCKKHGSTSASCTGLNNRICKCSGETNVEAVPTSRANANICPNQPYKCMRSCNRRGFSNGICLGGICRCSNPFTPDPPIQNQCNSVSCNNRCLVRGFRYGFCISPNNVCRCFR